MKGSFLEKSYILDVKSTKDLRDLRIFCEAQLRQLLGHLPSFATKHALLKFNSSPLKNNGWKTTFLLKR